MHAFSVWCSVFPGHCIKLLTGARPVNVPLISKDFVALLGSTPSNLSALAPCYIVCVCVRACVCVCVCDEYNIMTIMIIFEVLMYTFC